VQGEVLQVEQTAKQPAKGYEPVTIRWSTSKVREVEAIDPQGRAGFITLQLLDLFPEPAAILNIWENKLALVKGERAGSVVATE
jgi:hypothetical protein